MCCLARLTLHTDMLASVADYQQQARRFLPDFAYWYLEGGAENSLTMTRNRQAYESVLFAPKTLVDVSDCKTATEVCGVKSAMPAVVGPTGLNGLYRPRAEEALARAAHRAGLPFVLSTASNSLIESVRAASDGELWLQLYVSRDRSIAEDMMARARAQGYSTLLLTVDTPVAGKRDHYRRTGFHLPLRWTPTLLADVLRHPRWLLQTGCRGIPQLVNLAASSNKKADINVQAAAINQQMDTSLQWSDIAWLRSKWRGKILIKGIQTLQDARLAHQYGADGVVLSNHGGRQLDGAMTSLELLPAVSAELGTQLDILIDGGIRRGSDIAKAVALGAKGVLLGRAPLYGFAARGETGAGEVLQLLQQELTVCMRLLGCTRIDQLTRDIIAGRGAPFDVRPF